MQSETVNFTDVPSADNGIKVEDSSLSVDHIQDHISSKEKKQAQIRMSVSKTYPSSRIGNSLNGSIFGNNDFNFGETEPYVENRVAWIDVPVDATVESVTEKLKEFPNARIYRILSLEPILSEEQIVAMEQGISKYTNAAGHEVPCDMDYYREKQRIPNEDGEYADYKGLPQYRTTAFSAIGQADIDTREKEYQAYKNSEAFTMNEAPEETKEEVEQRVAASQEF